MRRFAGETFRSLQVRNFRLFFTGQFISQVGNWLTLIAQTLLVLDMTDSGVAVGVLTACQFGPVLVLGPWAGLIADRSDKRRLLIAMQVAGGILALILYALVATDTVELWMIYVLAFALGMVTAIDMPARQSFVIEMVGPDEVPNAVGLNSAMYNSGRIIGPAAAGVTIATLGLAPAFLANAVSFVPVIVALVMMRPEELFRREPAVRGRGEVRAGLLYAWREPTLRSTLLLVGVLGMFGFNFIVVLPLLAKFTFGGDAGLYSLFTALMAFGSLSGALISASRSKPSAAMLVGSGLAFGGLVLLTAVAPTPWMAAVVLVAVGMAMMLFMATANTTLQLNSDPAMRGRVMALYGLLFLGTTPVGGPVMGWIAETWGPRVGLAIGGSLSLVAALAAVRVRVRRRTAIPPGETHDAPDIAVA